MDCRKNMSSEESFDRMCGKMGDFAPETLRAIRDQNPEFVKLIHDMDEVIIFRDTALDRKTKRLIALACVAVRMCDDCVYPQAKVAKNYGATREEILEAVQVAVLTGGVPSWSAAKKGIARLFEEWDEEDAEKAKK